MRHDTTYGLRAVRVRGAATTDEGNVVAERMQLVCREAERALLLPTGERRRRRTVPSLLLSPIVSTTTDIVLSIGVLRVERSTSGVREVPQSLREEDGDVVQDLERCLGMLAKLCEGMPARAKIQGDRLVMLRQEQSLKAWDAALCCM